MMRRFVVLEHTIGPRSAKRNGSRVATGPVHWDWMFEPWNGDSNDQDARLWTWATDPLATECEFTLDPRTLSSFPNRIAALRLADHRKRYLDYEGEVGQDRGTVRRIASGTFVSESPSANSFEAELHFDASTLQGPRIRFSHSDDSSESAILTLLMTNSGELSTGSPTDATR